MKKHLLAIMSIALFACNNKINHQKEEKAAAQQRWQQEQPTNSRAQILNNIVVHEQKGLQIARAFLSFKDGELVPANNTIPLGKTVYLNLLIKQGWLTDAEKVSVGASQKIETDNRDELVNTDDLFKDNPVVDVRDASHIQLKATISKTTSSTQYFIVHYRVWDKKGDGEVSGYYQLFIQ